MKKFSWCLFIAFVIVKLLWNGLSEPLVEVHWDSVVHLDHAKQFADTALIKHHAQQADIIAAQVRGPWPHGKQFSLAYWRFSRLGHIALLGMIVTMVGAREEAIIAAHWLYNTLMALTMVLAVLFILAVVNHLGINCPQYVVLWAAAGSAVLYMLSPIYDYMGCSLVSEVPAMFLLTVANLLLITGLHHRSLVLSGLSGLSAFSAYTVRLESVWLYIAFGVVLAATRWGLRSRTPWWRTYVCAGSTTLACYLLYAWYFYPLANPYLFILFAKYQPSWGREWTAPIYISMSVAGGLLWIGGCASMIAMTRWTAVRMACAWGGMTLLPAMPYLISNALYMVPLQVRMLTVTVVLPLLLASTLGWASFWPENHRWLRYSVVAVTVSTVLLGIIAMVPAVGRLQGFPGFGMLNHIRAFLLVPRYERKTYRFDEMNRISHVLYSQNTPVLLVYEQHGIGGEDLALIRFFGPPYPPQANLTMIQAHYDVQCEESMPAPPNLEKVSYCIGMTTAKLHQFLEQGITVFFLTSLLSQDDLTMPFRSITVLHTQHYRLGIIVP